MGSTNQFAVFFFLRSAKLVKQFIPLTLRALRRSCYYFNWCHYFSADILRVSVRDTYLFIVILLV